ncbi:Cell division protein FtsQ [Crenothrix polyspora]|jgi:cell division protein FtsQ|uniref:Cell division protein FtsQ n=1 Tax=Crenothrix polyspora TaxID=360316 RepID=A0A1R4H7X2_9GAMM|nr:cell division protein FtsQ/DivIB [Crenothrix polyspora]SJM92365.1 Cell division protein FtsQ [Crenothrix polyspora]
MDSVSSKIWFIAILLLTAGLSVIGRNAVEKKIKQSFPIRYVRTEGVFQYLSKDEVKAVLQPQVSTDFFDVDMQSIQDTVASLPWVKAATVARIWPDTIDIKVHEKKAYVRWGKKSLITERGDIFTPKNIDAFHDLLIIEGPVQQQKKVLEVMKGIKTALADQSMELAEFNISERWTWKIKLKSGMQIVMGRNEPLKKLQRFLKTVPILGQDKINAIDVVDLRYLNGYAVSWKPDIVEIDWLNPTDVPNNKINE